MYNEIRQSLPDIIRGSSAALDAGLSGGVQDQQGQSTATLLLLMKDNSRKHDSIVKQ